MLDVEWTAVGVEGDADRVEADVVVARLLAAFGIQAVARRRTRRCLRKSIEQDRALGTVAGAGTGAP